MYLDGEAAECVRYAMTEPNYPLAMQTLEQRCRNRLVSKNLHVNALLALPEVANRENLKHTVAVHVRSLVTLVGTTTYTAFLVPMVLQKLPHAFTTEWHKWPQGSSSTLDDLLDFIRADVEAQKLSVMLKRDTGSNQQNRKQQEKTSAEQHPETLGGGDNSTVGAFAATTTSAKGDNGQNKAQRGGEKRKGARAYSKERYIRLRCAPYRSRNRPNG